METGKQGQGQMDRKKQQQRNLIKQRTIALTTHTHTGRHTDTLIQAAAYVCRYK